MNHFQQDWKRIDSMADPAVIGDVLREQIWYKLSRWLTPSKQV